MKLANRLRLSQRWVLYISGVSILGMGIGLIIGASIGYGPWDIFFSHFVDLFDSTFLFSQVLVSTGLIIAGYTIRQERPNERVLGMAFNAMLTGFWIDTTLLLPTPTGLLAYPQLVLGVVLVGSGINVTRIAMVPTTPSAFSKELISQGVSKPMAQTSAMMLQLPPMDFLINAMYEKLPFTYGTVKQGLDAFILATGIAMSFFFGLDYKLGIGTIIILIIIGPIINLTEKGIDRLFLGPN
jgi:uncharacterized membrane protein YczE